MNIQSGLVGGLLLAALASPAAADNRPGSLVLFPEFDNSPGTLQLLTITNTNPSEAVTVEIIYIDGEDCGEFNRHVQLTPNDTITLLTRVHNPAMNRGYAYAFAKESVTGDPINFDYLVAGCIQLAGGIGLGQGPRGSVPPFVFSGAGAHGTSTELNGDGLRNMDGSEYQPLPDRILIPRFLGQNAHGGGEIAGGMGDSSILYLIGLTGGARFATTVDFLIYNDNEEVFSSEYTFNCWAAPELTDISGLFTTQFLQSATNHDPNEVLGLPRIETGWMIIDGAVASSTATSYSDPAVLAVLMERRQGSGNEAHLPYGDGDQTNGSLLARSLDGTF
jgi:hypothetical protein